MKRIGIVGVGPRGLRTLECLYIAMSKSKLKTLPEIILFERTEQAGSGQVWNTSQSEVNWLNISQRALHELKGREIIRLNELEIPGFPSYIDWLPEEKKNKKESEPDLFPPRFQMGLYLKERYESISNYLLKEKHIKIVKDTLIKLNYKEKQFLAFTENNDKMVFDELVLTIGHQPTKPSEQLQEWISHAKDVKKIQLFKNAYPVEEIIKSESITKNSVVGIRGFGLSMIDVARALTIGRGGKFKITDPFSFKSEFITAEKVPKAIVAFSLDGLPIIPKPLNAEIDACFEPGRSSLSVFEEKIKKYTEGEKETDNITFLIEAMSEVVAKQYRQYDNKVSFTFTHSNSLQNVIKEWLKDGSFQHHSIYPKRQATEKLIADFINMATGVRKFSLDYFTGQVWRHCQPLMYRLFSHAALSEEVMAEVVKLDERMKRYAYGPPLESMQQLLALIRADILKLEVVNDPEIELSKRGWKLSKNEDYFVCSVMINSILDSPKLLKVNSPLITNLLSHDLLEPIHSEMGIKTAKNGLVELKSGKEVPLAVLGRLSKGSVLGVDAILECFRLRIGDWAKGVVNRIK